MPDEDVKLYNQHEGLTGRDGGPYLDQKVAQWDEEMAAAREGRKPDFENPKSSSAAQPLVTASELVRTHNPASNPSQAGANPLAQAVDIAEAHDDFPVSSVASIPASQIEVPDDNGSYPPDPEVGNSNDESGSESDSGSSDNSVDSASVFPADPPVVTESASETASE